MDKAIKPIIYLCITTICAIAISGVQLASAESQQSYNIYMGGRTYRVDHDYIVRINGSENIYSEINLIEQYSQFVNSHLPELVEISKLIPQQTTLQYSRPVSFSTLQVLDLLSYDNSMNDTGLYDTIIRFDRIIRDEDRILFRKRTICQGIGPFLCSSAASDVDGQLVDVVVTLLPWKTEKAPGVLVAIHGEWCVFVYIEDCYE